MITQGDVGRRVVVRRVVGERDGRPLFSDLLGELISFAGNALTVRDAHGADHTVPLRDVVAAKPVPPRAATTREILALERVAAAGWPAPDTAWLGGWLLRAADGWTGRANSVLPLGDPELSLPDAVERVRAWYADRGLVPRFAVPLPACRRLDADLTRLGWRLVERTGAPDAACPEGASPHTVLVQTAPLPAVRAALPDTSELPPARIADQPDDDWLGFVASRTWGLPAAGIAVLTGPPLTGFASVYDSGALVAIGRGTVHDGWLGLSLVEVAPPARRRGLARHMVASLVAWAARHRADRAYLQVEQGNDAALGLYGGLGFTTHHRYVYRVAP